MTDADLLARARERDKRAVAQLVGLFEDVRPAAAARRAEVMSALADQPTATVIGITGTPGSGKSSLVARVVPELLRRDPDLSVAVLAVDPSSQVSGGSLLGDRTRVRLPAGEDRAYFRSQATEAHLGGLAPATFPVARLLMAIFDAVVVETVGIGQSELDIRHLADHVHLVLTPLGGDEVQYLKAGIIEVPDAFVLNKCDDPGAAKAYHQLRQALGLARPFDHEPPPIRRTSARTGEGIDELVDVVAAQVAAGPVTDPLRREVHFLRRWVTEQWGRTGASVVAEVLPDLAAWRTGQPDFDRAQQALDELVRGHLCRD